VSKVVEPERELLLQHAEGLVLEVGSGTGTSFHCYPDTVSRLYALEPDAAVMQRAANTLADMLVEKRQKIELISGDAMAIPLADNSCDTVVCFLVLCSVPDPIKVLAEIGRVLKPGGRLLFFEHVLSDSETVERWQHRLNPLWQSCAGGCQLNRETAKLIEGVGFSLTEYDRYQHLSFPRLVGQLISGIAERQ